MRLGVFTDAPEELARIAVAQLGAARRIEALEAGPGALERLLARLGPDARVVRTLARSTLVAWSSGELTDRQLEALLERLDRMVEELARLNRRQESREELTVIAHELRNLNESLQALAYAALGQQGPQVRRRAPATGPTPSRKRCPPSESRYSSPAASSPNELEPGTSNGSRCTSVALPPTTRRLQTRPVQ